MSSSSDNPEDILAVPGPSSGVVIGKKSFYNLRSEMRLSRYIRHDSSVSSSSSSVSGGDGVGGDGGDGGDGDAGDASGDGDAGNASGDGDGDAGDASGDGGDGDGGDGDAGDAGGDGGGDSDGDASHGGDDSDEDGGGDVTGTRGRRRKRQSHIWRRNIAKRKRNLGEAYETTISRKKVAARKIGTPCNDGCFMKVGMPAIETVFKAYWALGNYNLQTSYIQGCIREVPIKRKRTTKEISSRRCNYTYVIKYQGRVIQVCRKGFIAIHGIGEKKVRYAVSAAKLSPSGTTLPDKRGKAPNPRRIAGVKLDRVHEHIRLIPVMSSHYSRAKSPNRKYINDSSCSVKKLYKKYLDWMAEEHPGDECVSEHFYSDIFSSDYNIGFAPPKKDTCSFCDKKTVQIRVAANSGEDTVALQEELHRHKAKAREAQNLMKEAKNDGNESKKIIAIDLQQTLPCPRITSGLAYYKRKLWVYNFCIYDLKEDTPTMFVWDEESGGRGSDEIASCLMKWLDIKFDEEQLDFLELTIFADNCGGQNKNHTMVASALRQIHMKRLNRVEFIFLVSGHSYMPCDRSFGVIEKSIRMHDTIATPEDYIRVIRYARTPAYRVINMKREDFFDVKKVLLSKVTIRRTSEAKFSSASQIVLPFDFKEGYVLKEDYDPEDGNCTPVRLMPGRKKYDSTKFNLSRYAMQPKYQTERVLKPEKVRDLQALTVFIINQERRAWLEGLVQSQNHLRQIEPQVEPGDDQLESDIDDDILDYDDVVSSATPI